MKIKIKKPVTDILLFFLFVIVLSAVVDVGIITLAEEGEEASVGETATETASSEFDCNTAIMAYLS
ncbi:MAG: hypothetical protein ACD_51C00055G0001, partial [uncultured bacterium]